MMTPSQVCESLHDTLAFDSRDWARNSNDAWIYGIVVGWDEALDEVAEQHSWSPEAVERLRALREGFAALEK